MERIAGAVHRKFGRNDKQRRVDMSVFGSLATVQLLKKWIIRQAKVAEYATSKV